MRLRGLEPENFIVFYLLGSSYALTSGNTFLRTEMQGAPEEHRTPTPEDNPQLARDRGCWKCRAWNLPPAPKRIRSQPKQCVDPPHPTSADDPQLGNPLINILIF